MEGKWSKSHGLLGLGCPCFSSDTNSSACFGLVPLGDPTTGTVHLAHREAKAAAEAKQKLQEAVVGIW